MPGRGGVEEAARLVRRHGPESIVLGSDAGEGGGDPLALPRVADRLARAGLSVAVIRRVVLGNALGWLGQPQEALDP
jgi:predicted metal-dependent TIM-barrel fold hydrolase